jgi:hypothetical protein
MAWPIGNSRGPIGWAVTLSLILVFTHVAEVHSADTGASAGTGLQPLIEKARGGQCVEDPAYMRRNHMKLLKHQRDDTMHGGIRTGKYSLKECVACHASQSNQSVNAEAGNFCQSCHVYAAVKIDCFECHSNKPDVKASQAGVTPTASSSQGLVAQMQPLAGKEGVKP